jgi:hypothetical protein
MVVRALFLCFALLTPVAVVAGGTAWHVIAVDVDRVDESHAVVMLRNTAKLGLDPLQDCEVLTIVADYLPEENQRVTWSDRISEKVHIAALNALERLQKSQTPFRFGYIGNGLVVADKNTPCKVVVRALANEYGDLVLAYNEPV